MPALHERDAHSSKPAARAVRKGALPAHQPHQGNPSATQTWSPDGVAELQRRVGNAAVSSVLQRQPAPPPGPTPAVTPQSITAAPHSISVTSSKTTQVNSLRPWEIFKTLPWNPSDGGKKRLYSALRKAHIALRKARTGLAQARSREAAAAGPSSSAAPAVARRKAKK